MQPGKLCRYWAVTDVFMIIYAYDNMLVFLFHPYATNIDRYIQFYTHAWSLPSTAASMLRVPVIACCPGHCATNLNQYQGRKDPRAGVSVIVMAM